MLARSIAPPHSRGWSRALNVYEQSVEDGENNSRVNRRARRALGGESQ